MHVAKSVANEFIERGRKADIPLTPLQIQKLVYYAHAWNLAFFERPLIVEEFGTWRYGPVVSPVYHCLSYFGGDPVTDTIPLHPDDDLPYTEDETRVLDAVFAKYARMSGTELSTRTHQPGSPWDQAAHRGQRYIRNDDIRRYYAKRIVKN